MIKTNLQLEKENEKEKASHAADLANIQSAHAKNIAKIHHAHAEEIAKIHRAHAEEIAKIHRAHAEETSELRRRIGRLEDAENERSAQINKVLQPKVSNKHANP